jgi:hypothetical protein
MNMNLRILDLVGKRLAKGKKRYGKENISSDGRDFLQESLEEALDCAVYLAAHLIEIMDENDYEPTTADEYNKDLPDYQCTGDNTV